MDIEIPPQSQENEISLPRNKTAHAIEMAIDQAGGKIPYSEFVRLSLYGPDGYYSSAKAEIGPLKPNPERKIDFTTSPESSELFGATIGNSARLVWEAMGKPKAFRVIEMGAGEGTLASSLLDWSKNLYPEFYNAIRYTILEVGELIQKQQTNIDPKHRVEWVQGSAYELPFNDVEGIFISNELIDTFPIEQITQTENGIKQKFVIKNNGALAEKWDEPSQDVLDYIKKYKITPSLGLITPINQAAPKFQHAVNKALKKGAILTIDYGDKDRRPSELENVVRCYKNFSVPYMSQYESVGEVDITADVDFDILEQVAIEDELQVSHSGSQGEFLFRSGLAQIRGKIQQFAKQTKSWKEVLRIFDLIYPPNMYALMRMYDYYAQLLTKGISSTILSAEFDLENVLNQMNRGIFEFPLILGKKGETVYINIQDRHNNVLPSLDKENMYCSLGPNKNSTQRFILNDDGRISHVPPLDFFNKLEDGRFYVSTGSIVQIVKPIALMQIFSLLNGGMMKGTLGFYDSEGKLIFAFGNFQDHPELEKLKREAIASSGYN